ncbi:MAG: double-strand break repair protein AddB [Maricaulis sp.]|nr:double-strand break repair protein AddB [Maricaulis sp.]
MSDSLFDTEAPRLFNLPPQADFLRCVAEHVRAQFNVENTPEALSEVMILAPTRRAARALGDAFADLSSSGVALLPTIHPIGEFDVDDPPFEPGELNDIAPEAISSSRRKFELARLILAKETALGRSLGIGGALALAEPLAALLDDLATEDARDLSMLSEDILAHLPEDRREAVEFLEIIQQAWPLRLAELGMIDPAERRTRVLRALVKRWTEFPPQHPVLAVGSTGSIPAVAELMRVVANLPRGLVVLPGFDWDSDEEAWSNIDDAHPQWAMRDFVEGSGVSRADVKPWPDSAEKGDGRPRRRLIAEALRPAHSTADWMQRIDNLRATNGEDFFARGLNGLTLIEADDHLSEARVCALMLREVLDTPGKTGVLVTPDRDLARRVSVEMARFGVRLDDSGGQALTETRAAALLLRTLDVALNPGSVVALSSMWGSPLFCLGRDRGLVHTLMGKLESEALRGSRPGRSFAAIMARLDGKHVKLFDDDRAEIEEMLRDLDAAMQPLQDADQHSVAHWAEVHIRAVEAVAASRDVPGDANLWAGVGGEACASLLRDLLTETACLPDMTLSEYAAAFRELARARRVPPRIGVHPRLQVLGPLEARLMSADQIILAGLNEGVWPAGIGADPWLSRGMRESVGLGAPERRHGLAAHDFAQLAASGDVCMTRAAKVDGAPTGASRWLWRLQTLVSGALGDKEAKQALAPATDYLSISRAIDAASGPPRAAPRPQPTPPLADRPRELSITKIRTWVRDPYAIYAQQILGIRPLDDADMVPGPRERGTALHEALENCLTRWGQHRPDTAVQELVEEGRACLIAAGFAPEELAVEVPRFRRAAIWLNQWEAARYALGYRFHKAEIEGRMTLKSDGGDFTLTGKSDRFDLTADGLLDIIDYKTGSSATAKAINAGFDPQLPLTAAMAREAGVFPEMKSAAPGALLYVSLPGNADGGEEKRVDGKAPAGTSAEMADKAVDELKQLIEEYDKPDTAYLSQPRAQFVDTYGAYDHLARRSEWASAADGGDNGEGS